MPDTGDSVEVSALGHIVEACDRYETEWRATGTARIEAYLEEIEASTRDALFRELLAIDVELRLERGEQPRALDYLDRFPDRADSIESTFQKRWAGGTPSNRSPGRESTEAGSPLAEGAWGEGLSSTPDVGFDQELPERLGRYIPTAILGSGGFGVVYLARDDELNRQVAIKVPKTEAIASREQLDSLLREARLAANLRHPAIVRVLDISPQGDDALYVVLEYIGGRTLADLLRAEKITARRLVEILIRICEGVHYAHNAGLVHRDLKPSNILIDARGEPFVSDFGLAIHEDLQHLRWGEIAGTPRFMAPEQVRGENHRLDRRTDVWAIGVILYLGLAGRPPFASRARADVFEEILNRDPIPLRQMSDLVPRELERICLKSLSKRMADRYQTAALLADDLQLWLITHPTATATAASSPFPVAPGHRDHIVRVVPKGLRAFDLEDADFFLSLLPGPRDRDGLPESIRSWKTRIEASDPLRAFPVGLLYGASGCGKSSLVKAGLLPHLAPHVIPIYVEASSDGTEIRLLAALRRKFPGLPAIASLTEAAAALRGGTAESGNAKVLFVLDQFEQWLHHHLDDSSSELLQAIRQCDGRRLQALVLVRDDFWMGITRFLRAVEVPLVEGQNSAAVELFDVVHARRVLVELGRAHGRLPDEPAPIGSEAGQFLDSAVKELAGPGGWIVPVRLSLFAEMVKHRPWTPATLRDLGGIEGIGVTFLEETFAADSAPPTHRFHRRAAMAVLKALLPEPSSDLKGNLQPRRSLQNAAGYAGRDRDFAELMGILDHELRMVTPVDVEGPAALGHAPAESLGETHFQLTHDYLVPPLRQWLSRKQGETREGRAELCLAERTALWTNKPESKQLPSRREWLGIRLLTRPALWTAPQRRMMRAATRHHLSRFGLLLGVVGLVATGVFMTIKDLHRQSVDVAIDKLFTSDLHHLPAQLAALDPDVDVWKARFEGIVRDVNAGQEKRTRAAVALARQGPEHFEFLTARLLDAPVPEHLLIREELSRFGPRLSSRLWQVLSDSGEPGRRRLAAASALASYDLSSGRWAQVAPAVVHLLLNLDQFFANDWVQALRPARIHLKEPLLESFSETPTTEVRELLSAKILAEYGDADDAFMPDLLLASLMLSASPKQSSALLPLVRKRGSVLVAAMTECLSERIPMTSKREDEQRLERSIDRRANAAVTLLALDHPEAFWPRLRRSADPRLRSRLIDRLTPPQFDETALMDRINREEDSSIRQALLIGLGSGFPTLRQDERSRHVDALLAIFESDPDSGVHGAAEWVLTTWGFEKDAAQVRKKLAGKRRGSNRWFITSQLHTMIVIPAPGRFLVGSPEEEVDRDTTEVQREVVVDYPFAVSAHEVTRAQFEEFRSESSKEPALAPDKLCPQYFVTWRDAADYCYWLTGEEGIQPSDQSYPDLVNGELVATPLPYDFTLRRGFRLPTEHEWEYVARAGASTSRFYGNAESDLVKYAWYAVNARNRTWPVGRLRPNPLGFFDIYGNVDEWCEIWPPSDPSEPGSTRGGGYRASARFLRSAMPHVEDRTTVFSFYGFRIAMTLERP